MFRQNTTTWSPGCIRVLPITTTPSPLADKSADGGSFREAEVFYRMFGNLRAGLNGKFRYIGIGKGQAFHVADVRIQHHLVDVAGNNHLFC